MRYTRRSSSVRKGRVRRQQSNFKKHTYTRSCSRKIRTNNYRKLKLSRYSLQRCVGGTEEDVNTIINRVLHENATDYDILGVSESASLSDIKKAYRRISLKIHPDKTNNSRATRAFQKLNDAYEMLQKPKKRNKHRVSTKYKL